MQPNKSFKCQTAKVKSPGLFYGVYQNLGQLSEHLPNRWDLIVIAQIKSKPYVLSLIAEPELNVQLKHDDADWNADGDGKFFFSL